ncbi:MAG: CHAT domain-containing protein [Leptolyngbyaceae cyanobacterium RU_5_1]|nr:CHAT domain-containing protein [Leptolyngbyaceae cyanobacterium RU_5_1]
MRKGERQETNSERQNPSLLRPPSSVLRPLNLPFILLLIFFASLLFTIASPGLAKAPPIQPVGEQLLSRVAQADLVQQGKALYDAGRYEQAAIALEQAIQAYRSQNAPLQQAAALANLSLVYQQLGQWQKASETIEESLKLIQNSKFKIQNSKLILGQALDIQGRLQLARGEAEQALATWQQAEQVYRQAGDQAGVTKVRLNQAQALRSLGFYRRSLDLLTELNQTLQNQPTSHQKIVTLRALGDALQLVGDLEQSDKVLQQSLELAQSLNLPAETGATLLSLGNSARAQKQVQEAIAYYTQAANTSAAPITVVQAQLNQLSLLIDDQQWSSVQTLLPQISPQLEQLPASRAAVYARINFALALLKVGSGDNSKFKIQNSKFLTPSTLSQLLRTTLQPAIQHARDLGDKRAESYALGMLGAVYERTAQIEAAKETTRQALVLAQSGNTWDIAYRWQWQLGRLLKQEWELTGRRSQSVLDSAIAAYDAAIANLKLLRSDLAAVNPDVQFNFRDSVEPIYRQSVELLLTQSDDLDQGTLEKAREYIEALQLAELDNFFREACLEGQRVLLDEVVDRNNPTTAILYPIVLRNSQPGNSSPKTVSVQVIAKIPNQPLKRFATTLSEAEFDTTLTELQRSLADVPTETNLARLRSRAQAVNRWLIEPVENEIRSTQPAPANGNVKAVASAASPATVDTLVFVLDDSLRRIPMAVLWDGQQYLVEKYGIALSVGLQLLTPQPIAREPLKVLAAGLSEPPAGSLRQFGRLEFVESEIKSIAKLGLQTTQLLNRDFTSKALSDEINAAPFNVVHLATHGTFSSRAEDTYILAADGPINVTEFDTLLRSRSTSRTEAIQLLVLSACQTAANDNRATLGLAGFAVRAGARSTLASLRNASDESTPLLIEEFYKQLNNPNETVTKAEALRRAQVWFLNGPYSVNYSAPQYWAAYVLIGNWL